MEFVEEKLLFKELWELWPKKDKEPSARKALTVLTQSQNIDAKRLLVAAKIYVGELKEPRFCHELGNWLREDYWKDIYVEFADAEEYLAQLEEKREACEKVINHWNLFATDCGWCKVLSREEKIPTVDFALSNPAFSEHWLNALVKAKEVFGQAFPETDWRAKIRPSISWFCRVDYDNHTVLKLIEGEYGDSARRAVAPFDPMSLFKGRGEEMEKEDALQSIKDIFKPKKSDADIAGELGFK